MKNQIAIPAVLSALAALGLASAAAAQTRPVTDENVSAKEVATTPASDLNLVKDEIPPVLVKAQEEPYSTDGLRKCAQYAAAIGELDAVLGPDVDVAGEKDGKLKAGQVAQSVVGSFIPFRGVIREVSGARKQQEAMQDAIVAGDDAPLVPQGHGPQARLRLSGAPGGRRDPQAARRARQIAVPD